MSTNQTTWIKKWSKNGLEIKRAGLELKTTGLLDKAKTFYEIQVVRDWIKDVEAEMKEVVAAAPRDAWGPIRGHVDWKAWRELKEKRDKLKAMLPRV